MARLGNREEKSACGVGFVALRGKEPSRLPLLQALRALDRLEHRGACLADHVTGDGAGVMADIPFQLLGHEPGSIALASLLIGGDHRTQERVLTLFEDTFAVMGIALKELRIVPTDPRVLGEQALENLPGLYHAILEWPAHCRAHSSLNRLLYLAKQKTRSRLKQDGLFEYLNFASLSTTTVVYKALTRSDHLAAFYPDLRSTAYRTRFCVFHRRFSTNTRTSWDKAQPFRLIAHNGEINTIAGNRSWSYSREQALGLPRDELLQHENVSDSGSLNEMVEALKYRSSIPYVEDVLAIMIPPADGSAVDYYRFWSRATEPWDGPALVAWCDGLAIGARIDRNGFRPCRFATTEDAFYIASEAGVFDIDDADVLEKGTLRAGSGVKLVLNRPDIFFRDPSRTEINHHGTFSPGLDRLEVGAPRAKPSQLHKLRLFGVGSEELDRLLIPMVETGKEPIGSMGDTAALAVLSDERHGLFDYFFQNFAQVTNPPLDYLREKLVTDLTVYLGRIPNIFLPKELIPPRRAILLDSPILDIAQLDVLLDLEIGRQHIFDLDEGEVPSLCAGKIDICFDRDAGDPGQLRRALERIADEAQTAVEEGVSILVLSDEDASHDRPPVPSLLALRAVIRRLNKEGLRLRASVVVASSDARTTHHIACLLGFGASAVCPVLAFEAEVARHSAHAKLSELEVHTRVQNLRSALEAGVLKVMSKMGISVVRSYIGSQLFATVGIGEDIIEDYFPGLTSPIGGVGLDEIAEHILKHTADPDDDGTPERTYSLKEHARGLMGERHSMTSRRSKLLHEVAKAPPTGSVRDQEPYRAYLELGREQEPVTIRHLLALKPAEQPLALEDVEPREAILQRFGSGAMSFGAISAESQRDIIVAMKRIGGRSGSGEGGDSPYYYRDGTSASVKQIASARFGVTAEYLISADEFEIKVAQGAKPGEGGQLMGIKVTDEIARARHASPGVDLISPPPLHDIYSIEDLKELIYELKQLRPSAPVCVKLVSGANIGTIAVGVVKAGADAIQISGGDGGTGAATMTSMKHAGLPWELGLTEVHRTLLESGQRHLVRLRVDGGLSSGEDIVVAAILGANEFGFGKLLLIAVGCILARVCEKNTCPRGIATHDPRFLAKYQGGVDEAVNLMGVLAEDVRELLAEIGVRSLADLPGRTDLLRERQQERRRLDARGLHLDALLTPGEPVPASNAPPYGEATSALNQRIVDDCRPVLDGQEPRVQLDYVLDDLPRALPARLCGEIAERVRARRTHARERGEDCTGRTAFDMDEGALCLSFDGSAGQGFGVFLCAGLHILLRGEANDSVAKSMSGGRIVIVPPTRARFIPEENVIIGNCALYGATGGRLFVRGRAGDRFAVRNSGAVGVIEGAGMHACEYMTGGTIAILGEVSHNVGAGMTGGTIYLRRDQLASVNADYVAESPIGEEQEREVRRVLAEHAETTGSASATALMECDSKALTEQLVRLRSVAEKQL